MGLSLPDLTKAVQEKVSNARIKEAIGLLETYVKSSAPWAINELARIKKSERDLSRAVRHGTIRYDEEGVRRNQLTTSILEFPQVLSEGAPDGDSPNIPVSQNQSKQSLILFLSANPADTAALQLAKEHREIKRGLETGIARDKFSLEAETAARSSDMRDSIRRRNPRFVHFSGHGISEKELNSDAPAGTRGLSWAKSKRPVVTEFGVSGLGIALLDRNGNTQLVKNAILAKMFELAKDDVECVIFNNCYSQGQAEAVKEHIPYVIGMNRAVPDETAIAFAVEFYKALADGEKIPEAFKHAQVALEMDEYPGFDIPILLA